MKNTITKIVAIVLLPVILILASGFCFEGLVDSIIKVEADQVLAMTEDVNLDVCGGSEITEIHKTAAKSNHNNAILPCCIDGSHSGIVSDIQSVATFKVASVAILGANHDDILPVAESLSYHSPVISPPEIILVRSVVLRL